MDLGFDGDGWWLDGLVQVATTPWQFTGCIPSGGRLTWLTPQCSGCSVGGSGVRLAPGYGRIGTCECDAGFGFAFAVKVLGRVPLSEEVAALRLFVCQPTGLLAGAA